MTEVAHAEAVELFDATKEECRRMVAEARALRNRALADLVSRRRALRVQLEELRTGKDSLLGVVDAVGAAVVELRERLALAEDEARVAAGQAGERVETEQGHGDLAELEEELAAAASGGGAQIFSGDDEGAGASAVAQGESAGVTGAGRAPEGDGSVASRQSVDELFARIRAGTGEAGGPAKAAAAPGALPEAQAGEAGADASGSVVEPPEGEAAAPEAEAPKAEAPPGPDDELIARRDQLLAPVTARLSRTVKRALGDDQNRLLDRLRSAPSLTVDELLGPEDEHMAGFAAAARSHLAEAFAAGTAFGGAGKATVPVGDAIEQSEEGLAHVVVTMLRRQMAAGGGELSDRVGAAFREWRGERVERLAGDYATQAFSAGVSAVGGDGKVRWVVTSASGCSDCEDNALAGAVSASETFPTGHAHPPAHSGCRCLVAPADD